MDLIADIPVDVNKAFVYTVSLLYNHKTVFYPSYLGEGAAQFDVWRRGELSLLAHGERPRLQTIQVGHNQ